MSAIDLEVVIPAFNAASTIGAAVESAFSVGAASVIVVDDGSSDGTGELAVRSGATVISQSNSGASVARRTGLRAVDSKYVIMLDADDALIPAGVEYSMAVLARSPGVVACGGSAVGIRADGTKSVVASHDPHPTFESLLTQGFAPVPPACFVWRSEALTEALFESAPPPILPRYAEDYEMLLRVARIGDLSLHDVPSAEYALSGGKSTVDPARSVRSVAEMRRYYSSASGFAVRNWGERQIRARADLRRYKDASEPMDRVRHLIRAAVADPAMIWTLARAKLVGRS